MRSYGCLKLGAVSFFGVNGADAKDGIARHGFRVESGDGEGMWGACRIRHCVRLICESVSLFPPFLHYN